MKKFLSLSAAAVLSLGVVATAASCGSSKSDSPETLDIYCLYKGYQDEWLTANIELFKQQSWVKEKYPKLTVNYTQDGVDSTAFNKLSGGESINKYDLLFSVNLESYDNSGITMDITDAVINAQVPGEDVKVKDKLSQQQLDLIAAADGPERADGGASYYNISYIDGMFSMLYNADLLKQLNIDVPVTTKEFTAACGTIKTKGYTATVDGKTINHKTPIMNSAGSNYWNSSFSTWWAQYEGVEEYSNFYNGIYNEERSAEVTKQTGRLRSLETIENIFRSGYSYESSLATSYDVAQTNFLSGHGVFHYNGDYFASEMALTLKALKAKGVDYDIKYMKMPVISSVVEKLSYRDGENYMSDAMLASVIREIDSNVVYDNSQAKTKGVSKADFDKIAEARCIAGYTTGNTQRAVIPDYSPSKALAADFLRFMYTDIAISNFAKASGGIRFAVNYDYKADGSYDSFSRISKSSYDIMTGSTEYPFIRLPSTESFALGKAGLEPLTSNNKFEVLWADPDQTMTAKDIYQADINYYWTENDGGKPTSAWGQLLGRAGYSN